jgi:hypothetical protein
MGEISNRQVLRDSVELLSPDPRKDLSTPLKTMFIECNQLEKLLFGLGKRRISDSTVYKVFKNEDFENILEYEQMDFTSAGIPFVEKMVYAKLLSYELLHSVLLEKGVIETTDDVVKSELAVNGLSWDLNSVDYRSLSPNLQYKLIPRLIIQYDNAKSKLIERTIKTILDNHPKPENQKPETPSYNGKCIYDLLHHPKEDIKWAYDKLFQGSAGLITISQRNIGKQFENLLDALSFQFTETSMFKLSYGDDLTVKYSEFNPENEHQAETTLIDDKGIVITSNNKENVMVKSIITAIDYELGYIKLMKDYLKEFNDGKTVQSIETEVIAHCIRDLKGIGWFHSRMKETFFLLYNVLGQKNVPTNPYQTLGVEPDAKREEILDAFYAKVKGLHPDMKKEEEKKVYHEKFVEQFEQLVLAKDYLLSSQGVHKKSISNLLRYIATPSELSKLKIRII